VVEDDGLFLEAAAAAGRSRCELSFPTSLLDEFGSNLAHDRFRLSMTDRLHLDWLAAPAFGQAIGDRLDDARDQSSPTAAIFREAAILADLELPDPPAAPAVSDLVTALVSLGNAAGGTVDEGSISVELAPLDPALSAALASVVVATEAALAAREAAVSGYLDVERRRLFGFASGLFLAGVPDASVPDLWRIGALLGDVDVGAMARASADLLAALDAVAALPTPTGLDAISIEIATEAGRIAIRGTGDSMHAAAEAPGLLVIDLGGNDTYRSSAGATASETNGVSVLLDLGGTDDYA
jgi:hypothetical protein